MLASLALPAVASALPATHFAVSAPSSAVAGSSVPFTVQALDLTNSVDTTYTGTVDFTSSDGGATFVPMSSTLTNGVGQFSVTLPNEASSTITATDSVNPLMTGTSGPIAVSSATHFSVSAATPQTAGSPFSFTVTALKADNTTTDTAYSGTVHFFSSDGSAVLPANSTLSSGTGTFSATLKTAGNQTIGAVDGSPISGTSNAIVVSPTTATHLSVSAPPSAATGSALSFTVTALDQFNNVATGYAGTVHLTSSDGAATLPADSTLTSGAKTFSATLRTPGSSTITAADTGTPSINGTSNAIAVSTASHFTVSAPASATVGTPFTFTVTARNADNSVDTAYGGTVRLSSSDGSATLPVDATLTNGTASFNATLRTVGSMTITANDTGNPSLSGTSNPIAVRPSNHFSFGKLSRNTRNGTATLTVEVPGPGKLTLNGKGVRSQRSIGSGSAARASKVVSGAGPVKLTIKATGKAKKKLRRTGKVKVKVKVAFTPTGGTAASRSKTLKLKQHH